MQGGEVILSDWTPAEWAAFLTALGTFVSAALAAVAAFCANLAKIRSEANTAKIDENTALTQAGTKTAADNAKVAATTAAEAKTAAQALHQQFNGSLDDRINSVVKAHTDPLIQRFDEHNDQDERNMLEIRNALIDLTKSLEKMKQQPCQ
jgi:DNA anti-recombination protein RmuC